MATYTLKANITENRLYICVKGVYTQEDNTRYRELLRQECMKLKKGFTCIQDLRELSVLDPEVAKQAEANKKMCEDLGIGKNAMVVASVILKGQMNRTFNADTNAPTQYFDNIEAAEKFLNA